MEEVQIIEDSRIENCFIGIESLEDYPSEISSDSRFPEPLGKPVASPEDADEVL